MKNLAHQVVCFSLLVKQWAAVTAMLGVSKVPAHMNKASPFFKRTNKLTIQGNVPLRAERYFGSEAIPKWLNENQNRARIKQY